MNTFIELCKIGNLNECQTFYETNKTNINIHAHGDDAFRLSCQMGHLKVAKWLYSLGRVNIHTYNDLAFRWSCENGHLEIAKWLYDLGGVDIHAQNDYVFRWSSIFGHIEVAKWLHSLGGVDIHAQDDDAFRYSCKNGYLEVAKWLHSLGGVNIHADDDFAFKYSCVCGHLEVAKWLSELCLKYELVIENNKIKSYNIIKLKDKIKDKTQDEIIKFLNIKTSDEKISDQCMICFDNVNLRLHNDHNHFMCFSCMIEWYVNNDNRLECQLCKTDISYQNMTLFI